MTTKPTKGPHIRIKQDKRGKWRWHKYAGNHRQTSSPGQGFSDRSGARRSAKREHPGVPIVSVTALPRD